MKSNENVSNPKKIFRILSILILIIFLILLAQFSLAKYLTSLNGNSKADIAKWTFKVTDGTSKNLEINLAETRGETQEAEVQSNYIGPGTSGKFIIEVDATGTEVSLEYNINMEVNYTDNQEFPQNLIFYSDPEMTNAIYHTDNSININGYIAQNDLNKKIPHTIYWKWDFETGQTQSDKDKNDIADNFWIGKHISVPITVIAEQVNQNPSINQYEVAFDATGGILEGYGNAEMMTKILTYNEQYGELPTPTKAGYKFIGWNGKNIVNISESLINGIRNETKFSAWTWIAFDHEWVKNNLKVNQTYAISYDIECIDVPEYDSFWSNNAGILLYSGVPGYDEIWTMYGDGTVEYDNGKFLNPGDKKHIELTFTTPDYLLDDDANYRFLAYTNRYIKDDAGICSSIIISNIQIEDNVVATDFEPYFIKENTIVVQNSNHTLKAIWEKIDS